MHSGAGTGEVRRQVSAARPGRSTVRAARVAERLRNSLVVVPLVGLLVGWALARLLSGRALNDSLSDWMDSWYPSAAGDDESWVWFSADTFQTVTGTVAAAMLTFIGVVFSLTILALQVASSQLSPRIMRTFVRSNVVTATLAVFLATFVYSLTVLSAIQPGSDDVDAFEPFIAYYVLLVLVGATLVMFVGYVSHIVRLIRVHHILDSVARETRAWVVRTDRRAARRVLAAAPPRSPVVARVPAGRDGVLCLVDVRELVGVALRHGCLLELRVRVGEHVTAASTLADVVPLGGDHVDPPSPREVLRHVDVGSERTVREDPAFGLRQIVDVAARALSPAVNDPTTAVQAIDRLTGLLAEIGRRGDAVGHWVDEEGTVRVVQPVHRWDDLLELAFAEIRQYGADSAQVTRRLSASIDELAAVLADDRHGALADQRERLRDAVAATGVPDLARRLSPDRSGLG